MATISQNLLLPKPHKRCVEIIGLYTDPLIHLLARAYTFCLTRENKSLSGSFRIRRKRGRSSMMRSIWLLGALSLCSRVVAASLPTASTDNESESSWLRQRRRQEEQEGTTEADNDKKDSWLIEGIDVSIGRRLKNRSLLPLIISNAFSFVMTYVQCFENGRKWV